jgi:hypothetical protein
VQAQTQKKMNSIEKRQIVLIVPAYSLENNTAKYCNLQSGHLWMSKGTTGEELCAVIRI